MSITLTDHRSLTFFAILRLRTQTNGATRRVSRAVGFQATPPIDYTPEYVPKKTHNRLVYIVNVPPDGQLNYDHGEERDIALKIEVHIQY